MKNLKNLTFVIFVCFWIGTSKTWAQNGKIHALIFTDDITNIATSCIKDREAMKGELTQIAKHTGLELKYYDQAFNYENANKVVNNLKCSSNDVIFFYYTGHGYRYQNQASKYPYMCFQVGGLPEMQRAGSKMLSLSEASTTLKSKGARLTIVIGDLCNSIVGISEPIHMEADIGIPEAYRTLFLYAKGNIISTSSKAGEPSIATPSGSAWTLGFTKALNESLAVGKDANWNSVLQNAKNISFNSSGKTAVYEVNITKIQREKPRTADIEFKD